jgi:hypothetical protein
MERRQVGQGPQTLLDPRVEQDRAGELGPSVYDPMSDGVHGPQVADRGPQSRDFGRSTRCRQIVGRGHRVVLVYNPELQAARAGIND